MGRRRQHDALTAIALLDAAEAIVQESGPAALSVRSVAGRVGTTTRAVYSVYASKEGLLIALGARAFDTLGQAVAALPTTDHPAADLVEAGVTVFRQFAIQHPWLFRIAIQHALPSTQLAGGFSGAAAAAFAGLIGRVSRLGEAGLLGSRTTEQAACAFHALCEGLAAMELRGSLPGATAERVWRDALAALVAGFAVPAAGSLTPGMARSRPQEAPSATRAISTSRGRRVRPAPKRTAPSV